MADSGLCRLLTLYFKSAKYCNDSAWSKAVLLVDEWRSTQPQHKENIHFMATGVAATLMMVKGKGMNKDNKKEGLVESTLIKATFAYR